MRTLKTKAGIALGVSLMVFGAASAARADDSAICQELASKKATIEADSASYQQQLSAIQRLEDQVKEQQGSEKNSKVVGISVGALASAMGGIGALYAYIEGGYVGFPGPEHYEPGARGVALILSGVAVDTAMGVWIYIEEKDLARLNNALASAHATAEALSQKISENEKQLDKMDQLAGCGLSLKSN